MRVLVLALLILNFIDLSSQAGDQAIPSSPGATSQALQSAIPVDVHTGVANIPISLYSLENRGGVLNVSLNYLTAGIKVQQIGTNVGMGWNLYTGGTITRKIRGKQDDYVGNGYAHSLINRPKEIYDKAKISQFNPNDYPYLKTYDTEADEFYFNVNGISGSFYFDYEIDQGNPGNKKIVVNCPVDVKIVPHFESGNLFYQDHSLFNYQSGVSVEVIGDLASFTVITSDGIEYLFDKREYTALNNQSVLFKEDNGVLCTAGFDYNICDDYYCQHYSPYPVLNYHYFGWNYQVPPYIFQGGYITSWQLSSVKNKMGLEIFRFIYENEILYEPSVNDHIKTNKLGVTVCNCHDNFWNYQVLTSYNILFIQRIKKIEIYNPMHEILGPNGSKQTILFKYNSSAREDLVYPNWYNNLYSGYFKPALLKDIEYINSGGNLMNGFRFFYEKARTNYKETMDWNVPDPPQLFRYYLIAVERIGSDSKAILRKYEFKYIDKRNFPPRYSPDMDLWGFHSKNPFDHVYFGLVPKQYYYPDDINNNIKYQGSYSAFKRTQFIGQEILINGNTRATIESDVKSGILNEIKTPEGNKTIIEYESNEFEIYGRNERGCGLRIKSVSTFDILTADKAREKVVYNYSLGKIYSVPKFGAKNQDDSDYKDDSDNDCYPDCQIIYFGMPAGELNNNNGNYVIYDEVSQEVSGLGKITFKYDNKVYFGVEQADCLNGNCVYEQCFTQSFGSSLTPCVSFYPFGPNPNYLWNDGMLIEKTIYGSNSNIVLKESYDYDYTLIKKIPSVKKVSALNSDKPVHFAFYTNLVGINYLKQKTIDYYSENGGVLNRSENYEYIANTRLLKRSYFINSDGNEFSKEFVYPLNISDCDFPSPNIAIINKLIDFYRIGEVIEIKTKYNNQLINVVHNYYDQFYANFGTNPLEKQIALYHIYEKNTNTYRRIMKFDIFDYDGVPSNSSHLTLEPIRNQDFNGLVLFSRYLGWEKESNYNQNRLLESSINEDGQETQYFYDPIQRISQIHTKSGNVVTSFHYNDFEKIAGKRIHYSDYPEQLEFKYSNGFGQEIKTIKVGQGPKGQNLIFLKTYDKYGRLESETYRQGSLTFYTYDNTPLGRIKTVHPPGPGIIQYKHETNEEAVDNPNGADYPAHSLIKEVVIDENGNATAKFSDKSGRLVMILDALGGETLYGYDEYNRLSDVIPPGCGKGSSASYSYQYDLYGRLTEKKLPDAQPIYYRYNDKDLMVSFQDGELRSKGYWMASEFDGHGRRLKSGYGSESGVVANVFIESKYDHPTLKTKLTETKTSIFGLDPPTPPQQLPSVITTNYLYNDFGQVTNTSANSIMGPYTEEYEYDMADNLKYSKCSNGIPLEQSYVYDQAKRLVRVYHGPRNMGQLKVKFDYTSDNELSKRGLHGYGPDNDPKFLQTVNYGYNERGWLNRINAPVRFEIPVPIPTCGGTLTPPGPNDDCNSAEITMSEFLTLRRSLVNFSLECYTECSLEELCTSNISIGAAYYFNPDDPNRCPDRQISIIEMKDDKGLVITLNYPYSIVCQGSSCDLKNLSGSTLKTDLENWLNTHNYKFKEVIISVDQLGYINISLVDANFKISQIKVHCSDGDNTVTSKYDCKISPSDPDISHFPAPIYHSDTCIRNDVISNIDTSREDSTIQYPIVLYELSFHDATKLYALEDELPKDRGVLRKIRCKTIYSRFQKIITIIDNQEVSLTLFEFLDVRNDYLMAMLDPGNGNTGDPNDPDPGPDVPDMDNECICTYSKAYSEISIEACPYFSFLCVPPQCEELHKNYPNKENSKIFDGIYWNIQKPDNSPILGHTQWRFNTDIDKDAIITKIKARIYLGDCYCPRGAEMEFVLLKKSMKPFELIPNKDNSLKYKGSGNEIVELEVSEPNIFKPSDINLLFVGLLSNGCNKINIDAITIEIEYELKCDGRDVDDPCNSNDPKCNDKTNHDQQVSLEKLKLKWNTRDITSVNFPARLLRLRLCNGDEIYVLDDELQDLTPPYTILQTLIIPDENYFIKFSGGNLPGGPNGTGNGPKIGPGDIVIQELDDLFAEKILYWESGEYKNGNISNVTWQVKYQTQMGYTYTYDALDRMLDATFSEYGVSHGGSKYNENGITYDPRGNILTLKRNGLSPLLCDDAEDLCGNPLKQFTSIDDLQYEYEQGSNRLILINDNADKNRGFKQGQQPGIFEYDANGNITYDPNREARIVYNHLNLPEKITTPNGIIKIAYDGFGNRIRVIRNEGTFDYVGPYEYLNGVWQNTYFSDGRIHRVGSSSRYEYFLKDHLGSTRVVFSDLDNDNYVDVSICPDPNNELLQVNHFYPFGLNLEMPWLQFNTDEDPYQYNGIEKINSTGIEWDFATYRTLDPATGRWLQPDFRGEEVFHLNPYNSMSNNPVRYVDPDGDLFFIPILIAAAVGGSLNLVSQALAGNVTNFGEGLAYFLNGAVAGAVTVIPGGGPALGGSVNSIGNKIIQLGTGKLKPGDLNDNGKLAKNLVDFGFDFASGASIGKFSKTIFPNTFAKYGLRNGAAYAASGGYTKVITYEDGKFINWEVFYHEIPESLSGKIPIGGLIETKVINKFSERTIEEAVKLTVRDPNKLYHLFPRHDLGPLVKELGGEENTIRALLNAANGKLPISGGFKNLPVVVNGQTVFLRGKIVDGIPRLGTIFK